ncbi:MAG: transcriptional repressor LexA [Solirubrobacteraceae bacterium]
MDPTKRQQEIVNFIRRHSAEKGYPPTVRDIGAAVGLASPSTVHAHLDNLEKLGLLRRDPAKPRALELLDGTPAPGRAGIKRGLPLIGQVAAGQPILAQENIEAHIDTPACAGGDSGDYLLKVRGESMKKIGIMDGDIVVVKRQQTARDGEIVVAMVEDEATVKRFFKESDHIRLQPENDDLEPILVRDVAILGRVVGVMRSL